MPPGHTVTAPVAYGYSLCRIRLQPLLHTVTAHRHRKLPRLARGGHDARRRGGEEGGKDLDAREEGVARALRAVHGGRVAIERLAEGGVEARLAARRTERRQPGERLDETAEEEL